MRPDVVVVMPPRFHQMPYLDQRAEPVLVQKLITNFAIQALGKTVFGWFARRDVMPLDALILRPLQDSSAGEFRAVVADDAMGLASFVNERIKLSHNPRAADGCIGNQGQAFSAALIHDAQNTKPSSARQRIAYEIQTPDLIDTIRPR